jgi:hypothetical protein
MTEFVEALRKSTLKAEGWDLFAVYSQARMETGNFQTLPKNNFWGMMPRPDCPYPYEVHTTKEWEVVSGVNSEVTKELKFNIYPTALEGILDYVLMVKNKFPTQAYPYRGDYKKYYNGLMTLATTKEGQTIAVYPSFSSYPKYAGLCIKNYEDYKKDTELYQLITGA